MYDLGLLLPVSVSFDDTLISSSINWRPISDFDDEELLLTLPFDFAFILSRVILYSFAAGINTFSIKKIAIFLHIFSREISGI